MSKVRTNIELEDTYVKAIMARFGVHTKIEAVDLALRHLAGQPMTRDEALAIRGLPARTGRRAGLTPRVPILRNRALGDFRVTYDQKSPNASVGHGPAQRRFSRSG